ncbi:MAG: hypothetical protein ABIV06_07780 [Thermoanaerobaculia bacterium]
MTTVPSNLDPNAASDPTSDAGRARLAATIGGLRAAVRQRQGESATVRTGADELHGLLLELQRHEFVQEPLPVSPRVYGRLLVFVRKAFYHLFVKWHARAVLQQQNSFNQSASRLLTELALRQKRAVEESARLEQQVRRLEQALLPAPDPERDPALAPGGPGSAG